MSTRTQTIKINLVQGSVQQTLKQTLDTLNRGSIPLQVDSSKIAADIKAAFTAASKQELFSADKIKEELTKVAGEIRSFKQTISKDLELEFNATIKGLDIIETDLKAVGVAASKVFNDIKLDIDSVEQAALRLGASLQQSARLSARTPATSAAITRFTGSSASAGGGSVSPSNVQPALTSNTASSSTISAGIEKAQRRLQTLNNEINKATSTSFEVSGKVRGFPVRKFTKKELDEGTAQRVVNSAATKSIDTSALFLNGPAPSKDLAPGRAASFVAKDRATLDRLERQKQKTEEDINELQIKQQVKQSLDQQRVFTKQFAEQKKEADRRQDFERSRLRGLSEKRKELVTQFQEETPTGEFLQQLIGRDTTALRLTRAQNIQKQFPDIPNLIEKLTTKRIEGGSRENFAPPLLSGKNFKDPAVLQQIALGGVANGAGGLASAAIGAATPLGAGGALIAGAIQQSVAAILIDPFLEAAREKEHEFRAAGEAYSQSILGITAVLQQSSQVVGINGTPLGSKSIGAQLQFQENRAVQIQRAARQLLLPQGVGGATEATFEQGITSALGQRGLLANSSAEQIAQISSIVAGVIRAQRPQLLENPALLNRDLQDVFSGLPQANRTILGSLVRGALPGLAKAQSGADVLKSLEPFGSFAETVSQSNNIRAVQGRLEGVKELNNTLGGEAFLDAIKPALSSLTETLKSKDVQDAQVVLGDALGRLAKVSITTEANFVKFGAGIANSLSPFASLIDLLPKFGTAIIAATIAANSGRISGALGGVGTKLGTASLGGVLGIAGLGLSVVSAATALTEKHIDDLETQDAANEQHVNNLQALRSQTSTIGRSDIALRNSGLQEGVEAFATDQSHSTANQLLALRNISNIAPDKREGAFSTLRDLLDKDTIDKTKQFGSGVGGDLQAAKFALDNLRSSDRTRANQGLLGSASDKASEFFNSSDNLSTSGIISKSVKDSKKALLGLEFSNQHINDLSKTRKQLEQELSQSSNLRESGVSGSITRSPSEIQDEIKATVEEIRKTTENKAQQHLNLSDAINRAEEAKNGTGTAGLSQLNNLASAQSKILEDKQKEVDAQQKITELAQQAANSFRGAFVTSTSGGAAAQAKAQGRFLGNAVDSSVSALSGIDSQLETIHEQIVENSELFNHAKTPAQEAATLKRLSELNRAKEAASDRREFAGADVSRTTLDALNNEFAGRNSGVIDLQQQAKSFNNFTFAGQEATTKNRLAQLALETQNRSDQIASEQGRLGAAGPDQAAAIKGHIQELQNDQNASSPELAQRKFAERVTDPFQRASGQLDLNKALQDSSHIIQDEADKRRSLTADLAANSIALHNFQSKIDAQTLGEENSLAALAQKIKAEGGNVPLGFNLTEDRLKEATLAEDVASFNDRKNKLGILGEASGGRGLNLASAGSPLRQAQEEERARAENSSRKLSETLDGLDNEFSKLSLTLQSTIDTLSEKLGIAPDQAAKAKEKTNSLAFGPNFPQNPFKDIPSPAGLKSPFVSKSSFLVNGEDLTAPSFIDQAKAAQQANINQSPTAPPTNPPKFDDESGIGSSPRGPGAQDLGNETGRTPGTDKKVQQDGDAAKASKDVAQGINALTQLVSALSGKTVTVKLDSVSVTQVGQAVGDELRL